MYVKQGKHRCDFGERKTIMVVTLHSVQLRRSRTGMYLHTGMAFLLATRDVLSLLLDSNFVIRVA
jgi:hypothetical protein